MHNLFLRLMKRISSDRRRQIEDYVTEAWCWLLVHEAGLGDAFASWLAERGGWSRARGLFRWYPQRAFSVGPDRSVIDLFGEAEDAVLLVEHKVWSPLHDDQMPKYDRLGKARWPGRYRTVLITARADQHTQDANLRLVWRDVVSFVDGWVGPHDRPLVKAFSEFLVVHGLGPPVPVSHDALVGWFPAQTLEQSLTALFERLASDLDLTALRDAYEVLGAAMNQRPEAKGCRWGRLGLDFPSHPRWRPGLFVGALLDGTDHRVGPSNRELGPDFVLIVSLHLGPGSPSWEEMVNHPAFARLRVRLANDSEPYAFLDHLATAKDPNKWHPLHLRRPMLDVLRGSRNMDDQFDRIANEIAAVMHVLLRGGELAEMARDLKAKTPAAAATTDDQERST